MGGRNKKKNKNGKPQTKNAIIDTAEITTETTSKYQDCTNIPIPQGTAFFKAY